MVRRLRYPLIALLALVLALAYFVATRFVVHQDKVDRALQLIPREERSLSPAAVELFVEVDGDDMSFMAWRGLSEDLSLGNVRIAEWHLRGTLWSALLPLRLNRSELVALYAHYMPFEGGNGVAYGSRTYFGKEPSQLSLHEAAGLVAISRSPRMNSPHRNPERFVAARERVLRRYRLGI